MKYRYIASGTFTPEKYECIHKGTKRDFLCIEIPSPFSYKNENEAMKDDSFSHRFVFADGEVKIAVYPGEDFEVDKDTNGRKYLKTWVKGKPFHFYNFEEFKTLGGMIFEMPSDMICRMPETDSLSEDELVSKLEIWQSETRSISWNAKDYETNATFADLFPSLKPEDKPIYIDDEAYYIVKEE